MAEQYNSRQERRKQAQSQKKGKKKSGGLFKRIFLILITLGIIGMIAGGATFAYFVSGAPKLDEKLLRDPISSKIYDNDNKLIKEVGVEKRDYVTYDQIPKQVEDAVLATEDARFYKHHGIDFLRLGKAVIANFTNGFGSQGASTLTQQVVKRSYLTADKTIKRKVQEMWLSFQLEQKYTKHEIFEMYVNKIFYSENANGIETASKTYYGKDLKHLKLNEIALLVGLPQSPNRFNPYEHPDRAEKRRNVVLYLMNKHGYITKDQMVKAQAIPVAKGLKKKSETSKNTKPYDAYIDQVIKEVEKMGDYNVATDGLEIHTTLDRDAQKYLYKMLNTNEIIQFPNEKLQAGVTLLDTKTGEIQAIGGGRNTKVARGFNYATDAQRQPGSTIKPILDYGPAVEYLNWSTYQQITDEPYHFSNGTPLKNASGTYHGTMTIREALARSLNIPAVKTIQQVGLKKAQSFATGLGIPLPEIYESYAIGGMNKGISSMQLAGAYSAFGNGGIYNKPHTVTKIVLRDHTTIKNKITSKPVMKDSTAFIISDMLKSVLKESYGTGVLANVPGMDVAGKTGSTNFEASDRQKYNIPSDGVPDSWMAGYSTNYTIAVWEGYDTDASSKTKEYVGKQSQTIPKKIFKNLMEHVSQNKETKDFKQPNSVVKVPVVKGTNPPMLASDYTPSDKISYEYFVKGHQPTQVTKQYDKISAPSGLSASFDQTANEISLNWGYNSDKNADFEVKVSIDGGSDQVLSQSGDKGLKIPNPTPGSKYTFTVTAIADGQRSDPASTSVKIPDAAQTEPGTDNGTTPPGEDNNQGGDNNGTGDGTGTGDGSGTDNGTGGTGDGTGNGNGSDNDTGGGTGSDNGSDNGTGDGSGTGTGSDNGTGDGSGNGTGSDNGTGGTGNDNGSGSGSGDGSGGTTPPGDSKPKPGDTKPKPGDTNPKPKPGKGPDSQPDAAAGN
ncbi:penicillin-binding protein 1A [Bacillus sp. OV322]|uniref:PBP1A family penicillin-binding protein n=1 Tax=Bacillus sp. OV322 TaxID=1882764 RepID=UPI0008E71959|nr:PBP1A family penicillin-binding protein [Bacillus sp. OV322]SFC45750.1 penicillin-binding protein 1A [Bacillus sp. OV322]